METTEIIGNTPIEAIKERLNSLEYDLRAEVIISELMNTIESGNQNFLVDFNGQFRRPFRKDVLSAEIVDYEYDSTQFVKINLSRDGIYDVLPEEMFHRPKVAVGRAKAGVAGMTQEYKTHKKEEEFARKFFLPFENEFFLKSVDRENLEKEMLLELNGSKPLEFFYEFWDFARDIPEVLTSKLMRILPYAYKIVGDLDLTVYCLSYLLNEKVEIAERNYREQSGTEEETTLGDCRLGLDMISGSVYMDYSLYLEFKIGPLKETSFLEYIHDGKLKKFVDLFYEYFLPMEIDVKTTVLLEEEVEAFSLKEISILGITTKI